MRLLILSQYFWPENFIVNDLARLLRDRQVEVTVLTGKPNYPGGQVYDGYRSWGVNRQDLDGIEVVRVPIAPRGTNSRIRLALNYLSFIFSASLLGPFLLRRRTFDAVFVYGTSPLIKALAAVVIAWVKRAPLIVWVQDLWPESLSATGYVKNSAVLALVGFLVRLIYRRADLILIQSPAFHDPVAIYCDQPEKIVYYPNFYQPAESNAPSAEARVLVERLEQSFSVLFAGNIGTAQDPEVILETARLLNSEPGIQLVLVGSGSCSTWLGERAAEMGLDNLVLAGRFAPADMGHLFGAASALLVTLAPQPIFALTIPSKVQAYLAAGRPIVGALDGEAARIIAGAGAGICVGAGRADQLAGAIRKLRNMPASQREWMGKSGRIFFERNFEPAKLAADLMEHINKVIQARENLT